MLSRILLMLCFLFPTLAFAQPHTSGDILDYRLDVSFDVQASQIRGQARIGVKKGQELKLQKGNLHILDVYVDKKKMDIAGRIETITLRPSEDGFIEIRYVGTFKSAERAEGIEAQASPPIPARVIDHRGIFLTGNWYPKADRMCTCLLYTSPSPRDCS